MRTKPREAVSYLSSPGYVRPAVTEVTVFLDQLLERVVCLPASLTESRLASCAGDYRFPRWLLETVGQSSIFM